MPYEKDVKNTSHCSSWRYQAFLPETYSWNFSQRRSQRKILCFILAQS